MAQSERSKIRIEGGPTWRSNDEVGRSPAQAVSFGAPVAERFGLVNGHRRFRKSGHLKFPSLAGRFVPVISRDGDRAFPLLAGDRAVSARAVG